MEAPLKDLEKMLIQTAFNHVRARKTLYTLSMNINEDIRSRITYSETLHGLNDQGMEVYIQSELDAVRLGANTFDEGPLS